MTYLKHNGVWQEPNTYVKHNGAWTQAVPYVKHNGVWVVQQAVDHTPPPTPVVTASVIEGRYFNVGVSVGSGSNVEDLELVKVLVSASGYPGSPNSSGYVADYDHSYPLETWSNWEYNTDVRPRSDITTYKEYPPNADAATQMTAGTYYISAFAKDKSGNWSGAGTATAVIPYVQPPQPPTPGGGGGGGGGGVVETFTEWDAKWSRSWYGNAVGSAHDGDVYSYGEHIRVGYWPDSGRMKAALGFPSYNIQNTLKGATITKVEVHLRIGDCYYPKGKIRFRYHSVDYVPDTWDPNADYGSYQEWQVDEKVGVWLDITSHTPEEWKTGKKKGLFFSPADDDLHRAIMFWGHQTQSPPRLRITYTKQS